MQPEAQQVVKDTLSRVQQLPEEEQIPALDFILNGVAIQRSTDVRELCNRLLQRNPPSSTLPGLI